MKLSNKSTFGKNNSNSKVNKLGIGNNNTKYTKKLEKSKSKNLLKS